MRGNRSIDRQFVVGWFCNIPKRSRLKSKEIYCWKKKSLHRAGDELIQIFNYKKQTKLAEFVTGIKVLILKPANNRIVSPVYVINFVLHVDLQ